MRPFAIAASIVAVTIGGAAAQESIVGNYRTASGERASIKSCGGGFCITSETGKFAGKRLGRLIEDGDSYGGEITDPNNDRTYAGTGKLSGAKLTLRGCALKVFCRTQVWSKL